MSSFCFGEFNESKAARRVSAWVMWVPTGKPHCSGYYRPPGTAHFLPRKCPLTVHTWETYPCSLAQETLRPPSWGHHWNPQWSLASWAYTLLSWSILQTPRDQLQEFTFLKRVPIPIFKEGFTLANVNIFLPLLSLDVTWQLKVEAHFSGFSTGGGPLLYVFLFFVYWFWGVFFFGAKMWFY